MKKSIKNIVLVSLVILLTGCFTGIESTPKITAKELKKQNIVDSPERHVLDGIEGDAPAKWQPGKRFYIADDRAARAAWRVEPLSASVGLNGKFVALRSIDTVPTLTDRDEVQLTLTVENDTTLLVLRTGLTPAQWEKAETFTLPHIIDMDVVDNAAKKLVGNTYYVLVGRRIGHNGNDTVGTRYQPVTITSVLPSTESAPLKAVFTDSQGHTASVVMTYGDSPTARRNFETIFALTDPRLKYKNITQENWDRIIHGKVALGMTPEECRLALGSPDNYTRIPTTAGMVERWTFTNGVYLVFEEGLLSAFRM